MPVFISHTTADDSIAQRVYSRLRYDHGISCYIDDLDKVAGYSNQSSAVTALVVRRVHECTNLLAIVTSNTRASWWVPFEVGVAREAPRIITSYSNLNSRDLPPFLNEWPVLYGDNALDTFAAYYKQQEGVVRKALVENKASNSPALDATNSFHRQLKAALHQ